MALQSAFGTIVTPAVIGTQTITGLSFQPKSVIFFGALGGSQGLPCAFRIGIDDAVSHFGRAMNAGGTSHGSEGMASNAKSLVAVRRQGANQQIYQGRVTSFTADGFVITWDFILVGGGVTVYYLALGGSSTNWKTGSFAATTGSQAITGIGFQPTGLFGWMPGFAGGTLNGSGGTSDISIGLSGALSCGQATAVNSDTSTSVGGAGIDGYQVASTWLRALSSTVLGTSSTVSSLDADGFTVSNSNNITYVPYLAFNGCAVNVGTFTQATSTGPQAIPITAGDPKLILVMGNNKVTSSLVTDGLLFSFGAANLTDQRAVWTGDVFTSSFKAHSQMRDDSLILAYTPTGQGTSTLNSRATLQSWTNGSFTLNWSDVDGVAREWVYMVLAGTGSDPCGSIATGTINVIKHATPIPGGSQEFTFTTTGLTPSTFTLTDGDSEQFTGLSNGTYGVSEVAQPGWSTSYTVSNGDPHDALAIASNAITVTVTNTYQSTEQTMVRYRRFALPNAENKQMFISRLEIVAAMGVGNTAAPDPTIQIRFSRDGGNTYGDWRVMTIGAAAAYAKRAFITRLGRGRNWVAELLMDDPVFAAWVQCDIEVDKGTS